MMRRGMEPASAALYAVAVFAVVVAPGTVLVVAGARAGLPRMLADLDLVAVSAVVGAAYALVAHRRLRRQAGRGRAQADVWIAALNALSVLAVLASVLLAVALHLLAAVQTPLAAAEWPLLALWGLLQLTAVVLAESTERAVFAWLSAPGRRRRGNSYRARRSVRRRGSRRIAGGTVMPPRREAPPPQQQALLQHRRAPRATPPADTGA
jgi:membrane protease YdiL (CAAX protease family)